MSRQLPLRLSEQLLGRSLIPQVSLISRLGF